jgi:hypothetical protein
LTEVLLKKVVQTDVDIAIVILLKEVRDEPVSNLSVEDEVANEIVLTNKSRGIFAKVVEDFHDLARFHHFFESVAKRINGL